MIEKIIQLVVKKIKFYQKRKKAKLLQKERESYLKNGMQPWSKGYVAYKNEVIYKTINNYKLISEFVNGRLPKDFGFKIDERIIEYLWIFSKLSKEDCSVLDAGSTFNFDFIVNHKFVKGKDLTIFTYTPEENSYYKKKISYVYGDLRALPFKDNLFDVIVSQSTIEHIDMDNSIYGYNIDHHNDAKEKSFDFLLAIAEMVRVLRNKGKLLITVPYGKFENHGFFQQFDKEMLQRLTKEFQSNGEFSLDFFKYEKDGWRYAKQDELENVVSYNPHSGKGKQDDNAAHCRSIVCIQFNKY